MPKRSASDIIHAAITDHRILKRPVPPLPDSTGLVLGAWQPPPADLARRNLGLAYFHIARQSNSVPEFQRAFTLLSTNVTPSDPEVLAVLGYLALGTGHSDSAIQQFQSATRAQPDRAEYWLDLGVAQQAAGRKNEAILALNRSIELDPYDYRSYQALAQLYGPKQPDLARQTLDRFLTLVPQSLTIRLVERP
jgi:tetratricopeptide (TPR) repeat protein